MENRTTITRQTSEGPASGGYYAPIEVGTEGRRVRMRDQSAIVGIAVWPDEAEALGVALIKASVLARSVQEARPRL